MSDNPLYLWWSLTIDGDRFAVSSPIDTRPPAPPRNRPYRAGLPADWEALIVAARPGWSANLVSFLNPGALRRGVPLGEGRGEVRADLTVAACPEADVG